jgi:PhoH-like ATPase
MTGSKRIYALDTNVLLHDPTSLFRFAEHDVFIPMTVLEELDEKKKGASEVSRNGRQVSRFLNELIERGKNHNLSEGLELSNPQGINLKRDNAVGRLYFEQRISANRGKADNQILASVMDLRDQHADRASSLSPRTSISGSRPASKAWSPRTTRTIARWTIFRCSTPARPNCRRISGIGIPR